MGERDGRKRIDGRAVRLGFSRAVAVTLGTYALGYGVDFAFTPVLLDLGGGVSLPSGWQLLGYSACVGGAFGWGRLRGARRLVGSLSGSDGDGDGDPGPGRRALAVARANRAAASRSAGVEVVVPVQRWTPDLLDGGSGVQGKEGLT